MHKPETWSILETRFADSICKVWSSTKFEAAAKFVAALILGFWRTLLVMLFDIKPAITGFYGHLGAAEKRCDLADFLAISCLLLSHSH